MSDTDPYDPLYLISEDLEEFIRSTNPDFIQMVGGACWWRMREVQDSIVRYVIQKRLNIHTASRGPYFRACLDDKLKKLFGDREYIYLWALSDLIKPRHVHSMKLKKQVRIISKFWRSVRFRRFIKRLINKSRIKNELETFPEVGVKYFEGKERFSNYIEI